MASVPLHSKEVKPAVLKDISPEYSLEGPMLKLKLQPLLKDISPEYSLEGLMLKLKLQYSGHLMRRTDSWEKTLRLGKTEGGRRRGRQRMRWSDDISDQWTCV